MIPIVRGHLASTRSTQGNQIWLTKTWAETDNDNICIEIVEPVKMLSTYWTAQIVISMTVTYRLEICRDQRSCKIISSCVIFSRKQRVSLQNLRENMKFTHIFGKFTHTFSKTIEIYIFLHFIFNKKRTKIINADIYAVLLFTKKSQFTRF